MTRHTDELTHRAAFLSLTSIMAGVGGVAGGGGAQGGDQGDHLHLAGSWRGQVGG